MPTLPQTSSAQTPYFRSCNDEIWPHWVLHSTDRHAELINFVEKLIIDLANSQPGVTHRDVALWLAGVVEGSPTTEHSDELHAMAVKGL